MDSALLIARILLAGVFVVAGLAKLADRAGSRDGLIDFGVPVRLAPLLGILLPLAELAVGAALLSTALAWWGALGALGLLLIFIAGISVNLMLGRRPDCHCFGQLYSARAGGSTLVRNGLLAAVASLVVWQGRENAGASVVGWIGNLTIVQVLGILGGTVVLGLLVAAGWLLLNLLRQHGRLLLRVEALEAELGIDDTATAPVPARGLPIGAPAPAFQLASRSGDPLTLDALRAPGKPVMLIFSDPGCGPCSKMLPEIAVWQRDHATKLTFALISRNPPDGQRETSAEQRITHVLRQNEREVAQAYQVVGTPSAVLVQPDGRIGSSVAEGGEEMRALVRRVTTAPTAAHGVHASNGTGATRAPSQPEGLPLGTPAPAIQLPDLAGETLELAAFHGHSTLVLFWNPGCGFCARMLEDLKAWERTAPAGAPKLLVVSAGTVEANQAMGLQSPVVIDRTFAVGRSFGVRGTPSAVLVDAEGRVASQVAVGAPAVLALARAKHEQIELMIG